MTGLLRPASPIALMHLGQALMVRPAFALARIVDIALSIPRKPCVLLRAYMFGKGEKQTGGPRRVSSALLLG